MVRLLCCLLFAALVCGHGPARAQTLLAIRAADHLACGTVQETDDWDNQELHGNLSAFSSEICRAVAIAILGSASKLDIHIFAAEPAALEALKSGTVQLAVGISPSASIAIRYGLGFGRPVFYDSQRIMVAKQAGISDIAGLRDQLICSMDMTPPERTLRDEMTARGIAYALMAHSEQGEMDAAVAVHRCVASTAMETRLAQSRANFHARTGDFVFLPERLTLNPMVPAYRYGDQAFGLIVDWTVSALIEAEALGVTQKNVSDAAKRDDMKAEQLLGHDFATGQALGLAHDWAANVIATTGNYQELFQRTIGGPYHLARGLNALWREGGLMTPLPMK